MTTKEKLAAFLEVSVDKFETPEVSPQEKTEAQCLFTAIMTDTVLEDET